VRRALFWMLLPLAIPQALRVRRTAPRFAAASGPQAGTVGEGKTLRLLAIGDSIVAGVGAVTTDRALAGATAAALSRRLSRRIIWRSQGKIGAGITRVREELLPMAIDNEYDIVVISVGVNDITSLMRSGHWARSLGVLLDAIGEKYPSAIVGLAGIPPLEGFPLLPFPLRSILGLRGRTFSRLARKEADARRNVVFLPLDFDPAPDNFHPSQTSYAEFGEAFAAKLAPCLLSL
jgi:lysophospholipase L1-like esterase